MKFKITPFSKTQSSLFTIFFVLFFQFAAIAVTNTATATGPWETGTNWSLGHAPLVTEDVVVPSPFSMSVNAADVCLSLTINVGGTVTMASTFSLSIAGNFANAGTFTAAVASTLIFNGASNSIISGSGTFTIKNQTINMGSQTTVLDVQSSNFITGVNTGGVYNFTFTRGTWKYNNSATLTDCHNTGAGTALTIPFNVVIESNAGNLNLCKNGGPGSVLLSGKLFINGGAVNVLIAQAVGAGIDFQYKVNGGTPQLYVVSGSLDCGAGFNAFATTDYIDFSMTGGLIHICDNGPTTGNSFLLQNVTGGSTVMTGGLIAIEDACTSAAPDVDFGGPNVSPFSITGGTLQLGYAGTLAGSTFYGLQYYTATNYPHITYNGGVSKNIGAWNSDGQNFNCLSLDIAALMVFDLTGASPDPTLTFLTNNGSFALSIAGTFTLGTSNMVFKGNLNQLITGTSASYTFNDVTINMTAGMTTSTGGSITTLSIANYTQTIGNFTAPANLNVSGNWTHDVGTFTPGTNTVTFNGGGAQQINGTGTSETFYNVIVNKGGNTLTAGGSKQTITTNNLTQTAGNITMTGLAAPATLNINGNYLLTAGTFTASTSTNIQGNWTKNGGTFTPGTNTVTFNGIAAQLINGSQACAFYNFTMNNTLGGGGGVTLSVSPAAATTVSNTLTLTSGLITTDATNIMWLLNGASTTVGSANSYVNGPMNYDTKANTVFATINFPIGKTPEWRPVVLTVKHTNNTTFTYNAEMFASSAMALGWTMPGTVDTVSFMRYWDVKRYSAYPGTTSNSNISGNQTIQLYFGSGDGVKDGSKLTVVKNTSAAATTWFDIGGSGAPAYAAGADLTGSVTSTSAPTAFTNFSRFTLGSLLTGWNPLPIELLNFTAVPCNNNVCLNWATSSETNNDFFTIEKTKDGSNFSFVTKQNGAGNSTNLLNYDALDTAPYDGTSYYRLKQTDFNGAYTYSGLRMVNYTAITDFSFNVYPNPASGDIINLELTAALGQQVTVEVMDARGRKIVAELISASQNGATHLQLPLSTKLASGLYLINLTTDQNRYSQKLIVD